MGRPRFGVFSISLPKSVAPKSHNIRDVIFSRSPPQIRECVIRCVSVKMATLGTGGGRPYKCEKHEPMHKLH